MAGGLTARSPQLAIAPEIRLKLYRSMLECRVLEKRAYDLFMQNLIKGTSHWRSAWRPRPPASAWP
jgi:TPP-dependent pyruvate/acetoin dehydrogenase alpha subunit